MKKRVTGRATSTDPAPSIAYSPHRLLEARSLATHAVIAEKMRREPRVLDTARKNIERWQAKWGRDAPPWVAEWRRILWRPRTRSPR